MKVKDIFYRKVFANRVNKIDNLGYYNRGCLYIFFNLSRSFLKKYIDLRNRFYCIEKIISFYSLFYLRYATYFLGDNPNSSLKAFIKFG